MNNYLLLLFTVSLTIGVYAACRALYLKYTHPLLNIVVLSAAAIIAVLAALGLPYEAYAPGKELMTILLGPATVALAVPLYRNRDLLMRYAPAILLSVTAGSAISMVIAGLIALAGGLPKDIIVSIVPKGVSIPFAVDISKMYGGEPALTAAFVVATGTFGGTIGTWLLTRLGIDDAVARGLALGTAAHAQGTAMALMEGERQGSMAGLAMILAGILTAALAPLLLPYLL